MAFLDFRITKAAMFAAALSPFMANVPDAHATPIASESFNYPVGELNTQNGGTGFSNAWTAVVANSEVIDPGTPLSYSAGPIDISGGNRTASFDGSVNSVASRTLSGNQTGDFYFSFLLQFNGTADATNRFFLLGFNGRTTSNSTAESPGVGAAINNTGGDDFLIRQNIENGGGGSTSGGGTMSANATYFMVGKLVKNIGTSRYDHIDLWINPSTDTEPAATMNATFTDGAALASTVTGIRFRTSSVTGGNPYRFDELRIGTTWSDVVVVPEPGSVALLCCGAVGWWLVGRRSRTVAAAS